MSGRLGLVAADSPEPVHLRASLLLDDGTALRFVDMRKFGRLYVLTGASELDDLLVNVGPEPLDDRLTLAAFRERLTHRRTRLKALLLDQRFLADSATFTWTRRCFALACIRSVARPS